MLKMKNFIKIILYIIVFLLLFFVFLLIFKLSLIFFLFITFLLILIFKRSKFKQSIRQFIWKFKQLLIHLVKKISNTVVLIRKSDLNTKLLSFILAILIFFIVLPKIGNFYEQRKLELRSIVYAFRNYFYHIEIEDIHKTYVCDREALEKKVIKDYLDKKQKCQACIQNKISNSSTGFLTDIIPKWGCKNEGYCDYTNLKEEPWKKELTLQKKYYRIFNKTVKETVQKDPYEGEAKCQIDSDLEEKMNLRDIEFDNESYSCKNLIITQNIKNKDNQIISWQTSAPRDKLNRFTRSVEIGLRNKYGSNNDEFVFNVYVKTPYLDIHSTKNIIKSNDWSDLNYPEDFNEYRLEQGTYTVIFTLNNNVIACDGFIIN